MRGWSAEADAAPKLWFPQRHFILRLRNNHGNILGMQLGEVKLTYYKDWPIPDDPDKIGMR